MIIMIMTGLKSVSTFKASDTELKLILIFIHMEKDIPMENAFSLRLK